MELTLETLVEQAKEGNQGALEELVRRIQDRIYGLAVRMLWHPVDAEDATQEILIKVITHLSSFRQESAFTTWVYRVACNHLLTTRKRRAERQAVSFEQFGEQLEEGLAQEVMPMATEVERRLLVKEVKIGCMQGMLLCLDRNHRLAYILGEIFGLTSPEGANILEITPAAFRKRLSRARQRMSRFMQAKCGLVNRENACRCSRKLNYAIQKGWVEPTNLLFANHPTHSPILAQIQQVDELEQTVALFRSHPTYAAPDIFLENVKTLLRAEPWRWVEDE